MVTKPSGKVLFTFFLCFLPSLSILKSCQLLLEYLIKKNVILGFTRIKSHNSLRGRSSKGKRKGIRARDRASKFPLPPNAGTQARAIMGHIYKTVATSLSYRPQPRPIKRSCNINLCKQKQNKKKLTHKMVSITTPKNCASN